MDRFTSIAKRILAGLGLLLLFLMVMDFNNRMADLTRLRAQRDLEQGQLDRLLGTQSVLQTAIAYATSEPAVEEWAREQGHYVRPGDFPIVPLPGGGPTPEPDSLTAPSQPPATNWEAWLEWFFHEGP
jgi:cell division protein FtsB